MKESWRLIAPSCEVWTSKCVKNLAPSVVSVSGTFDCNTATKFGVTANKVLIEAPVFEAHCVGSKRVAEPHLSRLRVDHQGVNWPARPIDQSQARRVYALEFFVRVQLLAFDNGSAERCPQNEIDPLRMRDSCLARLRCEFRHNGLICLTRWVYQPGDGSLSDGEDC